MTRPSSMTSKHGARVDRGQIIALIVIVCAAVFIWIAFELGQIRAGHNSIEAGERHRELEAALDEERDTTEELRARVAQLETDRKIDRAAYAGVDQELAGLEAEIFAQQEDLEFYRGIVADQQTGLRIQDFVIWRGDRPRAFSMRLVLAQAMRAGSRISGSVDMDVEGMQDGEAQTLRLRDVLTGAGSKSRLEFSFRYFQNLEAELLLPKGFEPLRVNLRLKPNGKSAKTIEKSVDWAVKSG
jgi:Family of unknown function (DUF6776)